MLLVTGATGYVGGRLVPRLLEDGYRVRVIARDPSRLQGRAWADHPQVDIVQGDALSAASLGPAMAGVTCAYYLIHSMQKTAGAAGDFHERDLTAARNFGAAARHAGVQRIIYLGGLGDPDADLSHHLRSRQETGDALREAGVPVTEFRAAVIVGAGSVSFEIIRHLTERLPAMICPRWVYTRAQPIAISNVLDYLVAAVRTPEAAGRVVEIGGADVLTYGDMMLGYARVRGLRRWLVPVPVLTPRLSSYWVHWVTPIPAEIAVPLIEGLRNEVVVRDDAARRLFPGVHPLDYRTAVAQALGELDVRHVESSWSDALATSQRDRMPLVFTAQDGMFIERRQHLVPASAADVFRAFTRIGGEWGWPSFNWLWRLRGGLDRLMGGVGFRRGRRDPDELRPGDAVDFWRVEAVDHNRLLRLRAEMKVPGRAWLQFEARPQEDGRTLLVQTAFFAPKGLPGLMYWYAVYPLHGPVFSTMIARLSARARTKPVTR
ncbi:MAG: SDR family oxidoreductase [Acidimicrobiia bacterium]|nr:SDR family oxidoreductase [Acidimicrobiia bacterium]